MELSWSILLKYIGLVLTVGTAFFGSWFFDFTSTDSNTGRKHLTPWGRRAIIFETLAIVVTLTATLWADYVAAKSQAEAAELQKLTAAQAEREKINALEFQQRSETALADIKKLITALRSIELSADARATATSAIASLSGLEDYKKHYPDIYERIVSATSHTELKDATNEGIVRAQNSRISEAPECASVPRPSPELNAPFPAGLFRLSQTDSISYVIAPDGVQIAFVHAYAKSDPVGSSYVFEFADGSVSVSLNCETMKNSTRCQDSTANPNVRDIYMQLTEKTVAAVRTKNNRYAVPIATAHELTNTFSCISP